jgi:hypothetical protein
MTDKEPVLTSQDMLVALIDMASDGLESQTDELQDLALELLKRHRKGDAPPDLKAALDSIVDRLTKTSSLWKDVLDAPDDE